MSYDDLHTPEARAMKRAADCAGLWSHVYTYLSVNAFLWAVDIVSGGGVDWAYWVSIPWAFGLLIHVVAYWFEDRGFRRRKYEQFLEEEQRRERETFEGEHSMR